MSSRLSRPWAALGLLLALSASVTAADGNFELQVKQDRLLRGTRGTLVFTNDGVTFRTKGATDRVWTYPDLRQIQILSPTRVALLTYAESGPLTFRRDERLEFDVTQGQVSPDLVAHLFTHAGKAVVTAVVPPALCCSQGDVRAAWRRRGNDAQGVLSLYADAVVFRSDRPDDTRVWRYGDMVSWLQIDPARVEVVALEGGGGSTRRFVFELKEPLPAGFYERVWNRLNQPEPQGPGVLTEGH